MGVRVVLAGPDRQALTREAYPAFAAAGLDVAGVVGTPGELATLAGALGESGVAVVEAELWAEAEQALEGLEALAPARVAVILPSWWAGEQEAFARLPNLATGFTAPVSWAQVAGEIKARAGAVRRPAPEPEPVETPQQTPASPPAEVGGRTPQPTSVVQPAPEPQPARRATPPAQAHRIVALWSGPAGGTGRTTLGLAAGILAAEWGQNVAVIALSEPAASLLLGLPRTPDATTFFEDGSLRRCSRRVSWESAGMQVVLGPARAPDVEPAAVEALVEAVHEAHPLAIVDLPAGGSTWATACLGRATDVVLVAPYSGVGVAAVVDALVTLRELEAAGRIHLVLNRVHPTALRRQHVVDGIEALWGSCPPVVQVPHLQSLADLLERKELPGLLLQPQESRFLGGGGETGWVNAVAALLEGAAGLQRPVPVEETQEETREQPQREAGERPRKRRGLDLGRLIQIEVTD